MVRYDFCFVQVIVSAVRVLFFGQVTAPSTEFGEDDTGHGLWSGVRHHMSNRQGRRGRVPHLSLPVGFFTMLMLFTAAGKRACAVCGLFVAPGAVTVATFVCVPVMAV